MIHEAMADCEQLSFEEAEIQAEQEANQTLLEEEQDNLVAEVAQEEVRIDENESQVSQEEISGHQSPRDEQNADEDAAVDRAD